MLALALSLQQPLVIGDSTPGGATDVWMWEDGSGMLWETGYFIQTN